MSTFAEEIEEQPKALQKLIDNISSIEYGVSKIASKVSRIAFFGMGSSLYSVFPAVYLLRASGISADYYDASEASWYLPKEWFKKVDVCVLVSQSGETVEIRNLIDKIKDTNVVKIGITANINSYLWANSDITLDILSGKERSVGSTKTHMNSVIANILFSMIITRQLEREIRNVQKLPHMLETVIVEAHKDVDVLLNSGIVDKIDGSIITSRGFALGEVYQSALTLNEIARVNVFPISAGMLKHGPMELFVDKRGMICFIPDSPNRHLLIKLCREISNKSGFTWIISNSTVEMNDMLSVSDRLIFANSVNADLPEYLQNLLFLPYVQILSYRIRKAKKIADDDFHLISKVTTEE